MFRQVVATMFSLMEENADHWHGIDGSHAVPIVGEEIVTEPESFSISIEGLQEKFRHGYYQFGTLWENILSEKSFTCVKEMAQSTDGFDLDVKMWAHILYDAGSTYHCWKKNRFKLVEILTPLYYARVATFAKVVMDMTDDQAEEEVERQAVLFEEEKPYLIHCWAEAERMITSGETCGQPS